MNIFERQALSQRRVVVTGIGALTPVGLNAEQSWKSITGGVSGIAPIEGLDTLQLDVKIAGQVKGFDPAQYVAAKDVKKMDRFIQLSVGAADMALSDSGVVISEANRDRAGVIVGVGIGGLLMIERQHEICRTRGPSRLSPFFIPSVIGNLAAGHISLQTGARGVNFAVTSACASGAHAVGEATSYIRNGECDIMIAGGAEAVIGFLALGGFGSMKALSTRNESPSQASRPFDRDRDGFVLAEGAGVLVLEDYEHASRRDAKIYAEVTGYGRSADGYHITNPAPDGGAACLAMKKALSDAKLNVDQIDYINAHGTSTPVGDEIESQAIQSVFGESCQRLWVSSTKSMTGHTLGGAGAIESIFCVLALRDNVVPPTINLDHAGEGCVLDYVPHLARDRKLTHVVNNSFGFGGTNACLVFSKLQ